MAIKTGVDAALYISTSPNSNTPVFEYCGDVKDLNVSRSGDEIEFPCRGQGKYKQYISGQYDLEVTFDLAHKCPAGGLQLPALPADITCWSTLEIAWMSCSPVHILVMDGSVDISDPRFDSYAGKCGIELTGIITQFDIGQSLNEGQVDSITIKPSVNGIPSCNPPVSPSLTTFAADQIC